MNDTKGSNLAGKLFLCMIGSMLIVIGGVFEWLMIRSYRHAKASREWPQVEAVILRSVVAERQFKGSPVEYRLDILFGYSFGGSDHTSDLLSPRGAKWSKKELVVEQLAEKYPAGSAHTAWVNPKNHEFAILKHDTKAAGYTIWFPAVIILGGAGMIWGAFRQPKHS